MRSALAALLLAALLFVGARPVGPAPAVGALLDPAGGVWAVARSASLPANAEAAVPGLGADVRVLYDTRGVPHIFAATEEDAQRALGFVVARDRLFQLELQARAGGGALTELFGARALQADRDMRRLGLAWSAERKAAALDSASPYGRAIRAYADGVNAYLSGMRAADVPLEYRLAGGRPMRRWEPVNSLHLFGRMGWTLAFNDDELDLARAEARVGRAAAAALFPRDNPIQEPIQPNGRRAPRFDAVRLPPPGAPDSSRLLALRAIGADTAFPLGRVARAAGGASDPEALGTEVGIGSNNWAVAAARTRDRRALLAGDPHLELTIPSIWYEVHLVVPGRVDVYGVTIPGAPGVLIGFNRDVAWSVTNTGADVFDRFVERVDDAERPTRYQVDGAWRTLEHRVEEYRGPDGDVVARDTLLLTHRGPMVRLPDGRWVSQRWTVNDPDARGEEFNALAHARSVDDALAGFASYPAPAQNIAIADRTGRVAIRSTGRVPLRGGNAAGQYLRDGSSSANDWTGALPVARYPGVVDPPQGFVVSANQQPRDPAADSTYFGSNWVAPWRAMRINALLRADSAVTPETMRAIQSDPGSARADFWVPEFLGAAARESRAGRGSTELDEAVRLLGEWDRRYTRENRRSVLFEAAMQQLPTNVWDELLPAGARLGTIVRNVQLPGGAVLAALLRDSASVWWDHASTPGLREGRDAMLAASLVQALERVRRERGADPSGDRWRWDRVHSANINHLLRLPALSARGLAVQGGPETISPTSGAGGFGSSWRMVVELGPQQVRAWTIYPGGQSGNPASARYRDRVAKWAAGELEEAIVPADSAALGAGRTAAALTLRPRR